jgi:lipopolysaccharide biosynthesis glycosyltransferase
VSLISLFETNKNHNISVYIITDNLAIENQKELEKIVAKYNQKLFIYN